LLFTFYDFLLPKRRRKTNKKMTDLARPIAVGHEAELRVPIQIDNSFIARERRGWEEFNEQSALTGNQQQRSFVPVQKSDMAAIEKMWDAVHLFRSVEQMHRDELIRGGLQIQVGKNTPVHFASDSFAGKVLLEWGIEVMIELWKRGFALVTAVPQRPEMRFTNKWRQTNGEGDDDSSSSDEDEDQPPAKRQKTGSGDQRKKKGKKKNAKESTNKANAFDLEMEPRVLPAVDYDIFYRRSMYGENQWEVRRPAEFDMETSGGSVTQGRHMKGVYIISVSPPNPRTGEIRSKLASLWRDYQRIEQKWTNASRAETSRSQYHIFTEQQKQAGQVAPQSIITSRIEGVSMPPEDCKNGPEGFSSGLHPSPNDMSISMFQALQPDEFIEYMNRIQQIRHAHQFPGPRFDLGGERKLVNPSMPEPPTEFIKQILAWKTEVLETFAIPSSMVLAEATNGKVAHNENAKDLWHEHMASVKQDILGPMTDMYRLLTAAQRDALVVKLGAQQRAKGKLHPNTKKLDKMTRIQLSLPGIPPPAVIENLYEKGRLKYKPYISYTAAYYNMPIEHFEEEPTLSVMELLTGGKSSMQESDQELKTQMQDKQAKADLRQAQFAAGAQKSLAQEKGKQDRLKLKETAKSAEGSSGAKSKPKTKKKKAK
jgi:hypothetical protein